MRYKPFLVLCSLFLFACDDEPKEKVENINNAVKQEIKAFSGKVDVEFQPITKNDIPERKSDDCISSYRVKIGDQVLMLPKNLNPYLKKDGKKIQLMGKTIYYPCEQKINEYVEADSVYFRPQKVGKYGGKGFQDGSGWVIAVTAIVSEQSQSSFDYAVDRLSLIHI